MITSEQIDSLTGAEVIDRDGDRVGGVGQVYLAGEGGDPLFVTVRTGLFGLKESFVPLEGATLDPEGLHVAFEKGVIKSAPNVDADQQISEDEQDTIFDYYDGHASSDGARLQDDGLSSAGTGSIDDRDRIADLGADRGADLDRTDADPQDASGLDTAASTGAATDRSAQTFGDGHDTTGPNTDDAMTLSEERLQTGVQRVETGRARLRKHVVTEQRTVTVPVQHDEVRIEREPITDENRGAALDGPDLSDEEHEVVLTEERPVVATETVPVERVRLTKEQVADQQQVTQDVRHEELETDGLETGGDRR